MNYFVHVTDKADQDLGESFDYIDLTLKNPLAADVLVDTAEKKLAQLSTFPKRYLVHALLLGWMPEHLLKMRHWRVGLLRCMPGFLLSFWLPWEASLPMRFIVFSRM